MISHVHQIGWQLRLDEHIEATRQAERANGVPPAAEEDIEWMRDALSAVGDDEYAESLLESMREGTPGKRLNTDTYRLKYLPPQAPRPGQQPVRQCGQARL